MNRWRKILWPGVMALLTLVACTAEEDHRFKAQSYLFLESLRQVEAGGHQLRRSDLNEAGLKQAMTLLDEGLGLAFQVERDFLNGLDLRLGKNYERWFIQGVQNYRLGFEAGDRQQQLDGQRLLQRWAEFWGEAHAAIEKKLASG